MTNKMKKSLFSYGKKALGKTKIADAILSLFACWQKALGKTKIADAILSLFSYEKKALMREKGFIGPIGDDLPSLIPLLFALMIFFYVFTFTWGIFDQRGNAFEDAIAALRVGNTMKGNNYMRGIESFQERCSEAQSIRNIKFMAGLLQLSTGPSTGPSQSFEGIDIETLEEKFFGTESQKYICTNTNLEEDKPGLETSNLYLRSFPVALEFANQETGAFYIRPMLLVVVTWR